MLEQQQQREKEQQGRCWCSLLLLLRSLLEASPLLLLQLKKNPSER